MGGNGSGEDGAREGVNIRIVKALYIQHSPSREYFQSSVYGVV